MVWVAGVDGCRGGWFAVFKDTDRGELQWDVINNISEIVSHHLNPEIIAIDVPIGLLDGAKKGGRDCDIQAMSFLGSPRASSVFSPPVRAAVGCLNYECAKKANRSSSDMQIGISKQCFGIIPKIREVDEFMSPENQRIIKEVHPEVCFWKMGGEKPTAFSKKKRGGFKERLTMLEKFGFGEVHGALKQYPRKSVARDDVLDAAVACWTAIRIFNGKSMRVSGDAAVDSTGLKMEMWI
jgi:predicted RNase H-like nuclease